VTSLTTRLQSALLSGLFLLGTLGVPLTDAALFHRADRDPCAGITHVERQGGSHHADRCSIARPAVAQREALGSAKAIRVPPSVPTRAITPGAVVPTDLRFTTLEHSRAPPA
jgi:hypothetical protein